MYKLEIETKRKLKKINNPIKAKVSNLGFMFIIKILDDDGKWHFIGLCFNLIDAQCAKFEINNAIENRDKSINLEWDNVY